MRHPVRQRSAVLSLTSFQRTRNGDELDFQRIGCGADDCIAMSSGIEEGKMRSHIGTTGSDGLMQISRFLQCQTARTPCIIERFIAGWTAPPTAG